MAKISKSHWSVTQQSSDGLAIVAWLSNNIFSTFQTKLKTFKWRHFSQTGKTFKKVAQQLRMHMTVEWLCLDVSGKIAIKNWKAFDSCRMAHHLPAELFLTRSNNLFWFVWNPSPWICLNRKVKSWHEHHFLGHMQLACHWYYYWVCRTRLKWNQCQVPACIVCIWGYMIGHGNRHMTVTFKVTSVSECSMWLISFFQSSSYQPWLWYIWHHNRFCHLY